MDHHTDDRGGVAAVPTSITSTTIAISTAAAHIEMDGAAVDIDVGAMAMASLTHGQEDGGGGAPAHVRGHHVDTDEESILASNSDARETVHDASMAGQCEGQGKMASDDMDLEEMYEGEEAAPAVMDASRAVVDRNWRKKQQRAATVSASARNATAVRNRRLQHMRRLEKDGSYFSLGEMAERCPMLFEEYVGRYMSDAERSMMSGSDGANSWAAQLMSLIASKHSATRLEEERSRGWADGAGGSVRSEDEPSSHDDGHAHAASTREENREGPNDLTDEEMDEQRADFERMMRERFLAGEDGAHVDYAAIDEDERLDDLNLAEQDEQDVWFDEDDD